MKALNRKLVRDLGRMRAQILAIVMVVACGVASYVSMLSVHASLSRSGEAYFERSRFPDLYATVNRAPESVAARMREIPGVEVVEPRIVEDVTLDVPGMTEPAIGRLVSIPSGRQPELARLHLRRGRWIAPGRTGEVLVHEAFANSHGIGPGDRLFAVVAGRLQELEIVGVALSPEYIFQIAPGSPWPDDRRFAVLWMDHDDLAAALDMKGAFNDVVVKLGDRRQEAQIAFALDRILERYGSLGTYGRDRQTSARFVKEELEQLEQIGTVMPAIFLGVAAFLLNVVMARMVDGQREQIAALKALGYGNAAIGWHYMKLVGLVALAGTAVGALGGALLGQAMIGTYAQFFRFPVLEFRLEPKNVVAAALLSALAGSLGTFAAVRRAVGMPPAEAMRPPAPTRYRRSLLERLGLGRLLSTSGRIVLRNLARRPWRTGSSVLGIALGIAILIAGNFSRDALEYVMEVSFELVQRDDVTVRFTHAISSRAIEELASMPGVVYAEPSRDVGVRICAGHRCYETALQGLPRDGVLRRVLDAELRPVRLPENGLLVTRELGERFGLQVGDEVRVEILEEDRAERRVRIAGFVDEMLGIQAYMELHAVNRLMREGSEVTGARLLLDPARKAEVYREIKALPHVAGATLRTAAYDIFNETTAQLQLATTMIMVAFASVVAIGVLYNAARVVLAERSRELASLRVIGFTRTEISAILLGELAAQLLWAVPLGCVLGYFLAAVVVAGIDTELYRFPLVISPRTYAFAVSVVLAVGSVTALVVRRKLDHLDLVEVLKTRE